MQYSNIKKNAMSVGMLMFAHNSLRALCLAIYGVIMLHVSGGDSNTSLFLASLLHGLISS